MSKRAAAVDFVFAFLENAADKGERCLTNPQFSVELSKHGLNLAPQSMPGVFRRLIQSGQITVQIYGGNWREVIIHSGPQAGKSTMLPPHGGKPHTIVDRAGRKTIWRALAQRHDDDSRRSLSLRRAKLRGPSGTSQS